MKSPCDRETGGVRRGALAGLAVAAVLLSLSGCAQQGPADGAVRSDAPRIVRQIDRPLLRGSSGERQFRDGFVRGSLTPSGRWWARGEIQHPRLRCASYALGLRFGIGDDACDAVDWRTDAEFLSSRRQCNNATVIHSGEGSVDLSPEAVTALNCVRVMVRCRGACG